MLWNYLWWYGALWDTKLAIISQREQPIVDVILVAALVPVVRNTMPSGILLKVVSATSAESA